MRTMLSHRPIDGLSVPDALGQIVLDHWRWMHGLHPDILQAAVIAESIRERTQAW